MKKILLFTTMALALVVGAFACLKVGATIPSEDVIAYKQTNISEAYCGNDTLAYIIYSNHSSWDLNDFIIYYAENGNTYNSFNSIYGSSENCPVIQMWSRNQNSINDYQQFLTSALNIFNEEWRFLMSDGKVPSIYYDVSSIDHFKAVVSFCGIVSKVEVSCGSNDISCTILSISQLNNYTNNNGLLTYFAQLNSTYENLHNNYYEQDGNLGDFNLGYNAGFQAGVESIDTNSIYQNGYDDGVDAQSIVTENQASNYQSIIDGKDEQIADLQVQLNSDDHINFKFYDLLNNIFKYPMNAVNTIFYHNDQPVEIFGVSIVGVVIGIFSIGLCITIIAIVKKVWK